MKMQIFKYLECVTSMAFHQRYTRTRADDHGLPNQGHRRLPMRRPPPPDCSSTEMMYRTTADQGECPFWASQRDNNGCCVFRPEFGTLTRQTRDEQYLFMLRAIMGRRQVESNTHFIDWVYNTLPEWRFASFDNSSMPIKAPISMDDHRIGEINQFMALVAPDNIEVQVEVPSGTRTPSRFRYVNNIHGNSKYTCPTQGAMIDVWDMGDDMLTNWLQRTPFEDLTPHLRSDIQDCTLSIEGVAAVIPRMYGYDREYCFLNILLSVHDMCVFGGRMREKCWVEIIERRRTANIPSTYRSLVSETRSEAVDVMRRLENYIGQHAFQTFAVPAHRLQSRRGRGVEILVTSRIIHYACGTPVTFLVQIYPFVFIALNNRSGARS